MSGTKVYLTIFNAPARTVSGVITQSRKEIKRLKASKLNFIQYANGTML
jgi:Na+/melibiose symporter-like transporter